MKQRSVCLKDIEHTKRFYAKLINEYNRDTITTEKFRSLIYALSKYIEALKGSDLEKKLEELEAKFDLFPKK